MTPFLYELSVPWISTGPPVTILTRFLAEPGTTRLTVLPRPSRNWENELKALPPLMVEVVIVVVRPETPIIVAVRPVARMLLPGDWPILTAWASAGGAPNRPQASGNAAELPSNARLRALIATCRFNRASIFTFPFCDCLITPGSRNPSLHQNFPG